MKFYQRNPSFFLLRVFLLLVFIFMLLFPHQVFVGTCEGLILWAHTVLPTIFPFMVISQLLIESQAFQYITRLFGAFLKSFFHTSKEGSFAIIIGFLCGYPLGSKTIADLYYHHQIDRNEASYLLSFCNNCSPAFIISFLCSQILQNQKLVLPTLLLLLGTPISMSFLFRFFWKTKSIFTNPSHKKPTIDLTHHSFSKLLEDALFHSIQCIEMIGGYMIVFSIIICMLSTKKALSYDPLHYILLPGLEITNGISILNNANICFTKKYPLLIFCASHGGMCSMAQTMSMIHKTDLSIYHYCIEKLATATVASLFAYIFALFYSLN